MRTSLASGIGGWMIADVVDTRNVLVMEGWKEGKRGSDEAGFGL